MTESIANTDTVPRKPRRPADFPAPDIPVIRRLCALRSLRPVPESMPDLQTLGPRSRFAARPNPPDRAGRSRPAPAWRILRETYRPVPGLPRVRDRMPLRRRVRQTGRSRARADRAELPAAIFFAPCAGFCFPPPAAVSAPHRDRRAHPRTFTSVRACNRSRAQPAFFACSGLRTASGCCRQSIANSFFSKLGRTYPAVGHRRARVALFAGCIAQVSFSALHEATIRVLTANGCEVVVPAGQTCCGALAAHAGVRDAARSLARTNLDVFLGDDFDAVITNAAGCGSTLKEYEQLFAAGSEEHAKAAAFRKKMRDVTEFLADLGMTRTSREPAAPRHVPGFLPSAARPKNSRSPAQADARHPRRGTGRNGHGRLLLRLGGLLQCHRDANFARNSWRKR